MIASMEPLHVSESDAVRDLAAILKRVQAGAEVVIERDAEGYYVASVPQIPACHTQARSLDEVTERIREAIELCLEVEGAPEQDLEFVGIQRVTIAA